jgi:hypothetical protein
MAARGLIDCLSPMQRPQNEDSLVTVFSSRSHLANVEAEVIQSLLESAGIDCWLARENVIQQPVGNVLVKVLESNAEDAMALLRDAVIAGEAEDQ